VPAGEDGRVLSDEEIAAMSPEERGELIRRLSRPVEEIVPSPRWLRRTREVWVTLVVASALVLVPWIVYLALTLPRAYVAHNWDRTWAGFDVLLLVLMVATAVFGWLRRQVMVLTAFATGVLLVADAWFDVMTAGSADVTVSLLTALRVELPLAAVLTGGSLVVVRLTAERLWALDRGRPVWQARIPLPAHRDRAVRRRAGRPPLRE
jgi:hypothetical protein